MEQAPEVQQDMVVDAIRNSATRVAFTTHKWNPMKTNTALAVEVKGIKSAKGRAVQAKVNLANGFENLLSQVTRVMSRAYHAHIRMTVPWGEGDRLLPNLQLIEYMTEMQGHRTALDAAKISVKLKLPAAIAQAIINNGDLGLASDYPSVDVIVDTFDYEWEFEPISDTAGFAGLPEGFRERFEMNYQGRVTRLLDTGVDDCKVRLATLLTAWYETLTKDKPKFFQGTIDNLVQLGKTLHSMNIGKDPDLTTVCGHIADLAEYSAENLRDNMSLRLATAATVKGLLMALCANIEEVEPDPFVPTPSTEAPTGPSPELRQVVEAMTEPTPPVEVTPAPEVSTVETEDTPVDDDPNGIADILANLF
jgi:hypothetical protein